MTKRRICGISILVLGIFLTACVQNPRTQIQRAFKEVCGGEAYAGSAPYSGAGPHPVILLSQDGTGHEWNDLIPDTWSPESAEDTQMVACIDPPTKIEIEFCKYYGPGIARYRYQRFIRLVEARTGLIVVEDRIQGSLPRECNSFEDYGLTELLGEELSYQDLESWLRYYIETDAQPVSAVPAQARPTHPPVAQGLVNREINTFCGYYGDSPQSVEYGQEVIFYWRWGAATKEYLEDFLQASSFTVSLDDRRLSIASVEVERPCPEGVFCASWELSESMFLDFGIHRALLSIQLDREITDGFDNNQDGDPDVYGPGTWDAEPACEVIVE